MLKIQCKLFNMTGMEYMMRSLLFFQIRLYPPDTMAQGPVSSGPLPKVGWGLPGGGTPQLESRVDRFDLISEDRATSHEDPTNELPQGTQLTLPLPNLLIPLGEILRKA